MERKSKVTQESVSSACNALLAAGKNITVNAVIGVTGGSFSTVGTMVKQWKEEQAQQLAPVIEMPESITQAMQKATIEIWTTASSLASEAVERIQKETGEAITKAKGEISEYSGEVSRLENELLNAEQKTVDSDKRLTDMQTSFATLTNQNTALETRLSDRDSELERLRSDYEKLQAELIEIAKAKQEETKNKKDRS
jgi:chromosome segregation ATPase